MTTRARRERRSVCREAQRSSRRASRQLPQFFNLKTVAIWLRRRPEALGNLLLDSLYKLAQKSNRFLPVEFQSEQAHIDAFVNKNIQVNSDGLLERR